MGRRALLGAALAALAALVAVVWFSAWHGRAERRASEAFAALSQCLVGQRPSAVAIPRRSLRAVEVAASLSPDHETWPARCARYLDALESSVGELASRDCEGGDERCARVMELSEEIGHAGELLRLGRNDAFDVDKLYALALELGLDGDAPAGVPMPPEPVALLEPTRMTPLYRGNYLRLLTDPAGDSRLELLFYEHETRYGHCVVDLGRRADASCRILPSNIPVGLAGELLAAEPGAPVRMYAQGPAGDGWLQALYDVESGALIAELPDRPAGAFVWRDGTVAHVGKREGEAALFRIRARDALPPVALELPERVSVGPRLVWDEVVWAVPEAEGQHRVFARRLLPGDVGLGPARELGVTDGFEGEPTLDVCRSEGALVLVVGRQSREGAIGSLLFRTAAGWQPPVHVRTPASRFGFTCDGDTATLSWIIGAKEHAEEPAWGASATTARAVVGSYHVHRLRCSPAGCEHKRAALVLRRFSQASRYVAGDLGRAMTVMWRSPTGDVRMRVAPLEDLAKAQDVPLFDDVEHEGFDWDLESDPIFGRAGSMVVLMSRQIDVSEEQSAIYGFRVDASGAITPVGVAPAL